jgi:tetratricopeptide (TPR) repeat protein
MNWSKTGFVFTLCAVISACSSGPTEEEIAVQVEDFRQRSAQYFNAGSFGQAYQQARLGLELTPADDGELNLLAGHALMMMRNLRDVAKSEKYLLRAQEALETYRADLVLGEYHLRYGAMLNAHARRQLKLAKELSTLDEDQLQEEVETNEERIEVAEQHFRDATQLFLTALEQSPNDLHALQLIGQSCAYLNDHATARTHLEHAIEIFTESRQYKNRILATDTKINLRQETLLRAEMLKDINAEVSIRILLAGLDKINNDTSAEIEQYSTILALSPNNLNINFARGLCYYKTGNIALAIADLEHFISNTDLPFEHPQVRRAFEITNDLK